MLFAFIIIYSCSKDEDLLRDGVLNDQAISIDDLSIETFEDEATSAQEIIAEELIEDNIVSDIFETRTTIFPPINDGHVQGENGYNQNIVRLEEGRRISYLMFDISQIGSLGGTLDKTNLEFTIDSDEGNGTISVFKGISNDWMENELNALTAPEADSLVGQLSADYNLGSTHEVPLDTALIKSEIVSLVMHHQDGNDLAFASKEHPTQKGPALIVTYKVPPGAAAIVVEENTVELETEAPSTDTEEDIDGEESTEEPSANEEGLDEASEDNQEEVTEESENSESETVAEEETDVEEEITTEENVDTASESDSEEVENIETEESGETSVQTNEEPRAVAEADKTSGNAPLEVNFNGSNSNDDQGIETYVWDFRDGATSNEPNPTHIFENEGTLAVRLTVTDAEGLTNTDTITITIGEEEQESTAPTAVASASTASGNLPLEVQFRADSSSDNGEIETYRWNFKDGNTTGSKNPTHIFEEVGTYLVELTVTDDEGLSNTDTITITITEEEQESTAPTAVASASTTSGDLPLEVQFRADSSSDDGEIETYQWNFKDGNSTGSKNPTHIFEEVGTYLVELTVTDDEGLSSSETIEISVNEIENTPPVAKATASPQSGYAPLEVSFRGDASEDDKGIEAYFWDFGDGNTTNSKNPSHTFTDAGTYTVELSVRDNEGQTQATTIEIVVDQRPVDNPDNGGEEENTGGGGSDGGDNNNDPDDGDGGNDIEDNSGDSGSYPSNAVFASSFGFRAGDATDAFQSALKSGNSYIVVDKQSSDWVIRPTTLFDLRNVTIVFESGVILRAKSGAFSQTNDQLFQLLRANNVTIEGYGATFQMNKNEYSNGEHRHALSLNKCKNITIRGLTFRDSGGDGIAIAGIEAGSYSEDITIEDVVCTNNRRLGMGIISAQDVWIRNSEFSNTRGTLPEAGVDLEPNHSNERLVNINFSNCKFSNNASRGFFLSTGKLTSSSIPISVKVTNCEFSNNAGSGIKQEGEIALSSGIATNPVKGEIIFEGTRFNGSDNRILLSKKPSESYNAVFRNCTASNVARNSSSVIYLEGLSTTNNLGGFVFDNFAIEYSKNLPFMSIGARSSGFSVKDIRGDFEITEPYDNSLEYLFGYNANNNVNVSINYQHN